MILAGCTAIYKVYASFDSDSNQAVVTQIEEFRPELVPTPAPPTPAASQTKTAQGEAVPLLWQPFGSQWDMVTNFDFYYRSSNGILLGEKNKETITIPTTLPENYVVATIEILNLENKKYYSAYLDFKTNNVYIGPKISEEMAKAIIIADEIRFGVFTWDAESASTLVSKLGTPKRHPPHKGSGSYKHYHLMKRNSSKDEPINTHVWYYM